MSILVNLVVIFNTVAFCLFLLNRPKFKILFFLATTICLFLLQINTTTPTDFAHPTEIERIESFRRRDEYPVGTYRLAHIIETRPESFLISKISTNFLEIFNLNLLFNQYYSPLLLPLFIVGLFSLIKLYPHISLLFLPNLLLITIIGHQNTLGPFVLFPIINFGLLFGIIYLIGYVKIHH